MVLMWTDLYNMSLLSHLNCGTTSVNWPRVSMNKRVEKLQWGQFAWEDQILMKGVPSQCDPIYHELRVLLPLSCATGWCCWDTGRVFRASYYFKSCGCNCIHIQPSNGTFKQSLRSIMTLVFMACLLTRLLQLHQQTILTSKPCCCVFWQPASQLACNKRATCAA